VVRPISAAQVVLVGVRDFDPPEADYVRGRDILVFGDDVFRKPSALMDVLRQRGLHHVHVHFDVDVLNPAHFPAALMQAPGGGPTLDEAIALIAAVQAAVDGVGLSVLEFCARDAAWTARLASAVRSVVW
jgi:arginase